VDSRLRRQFTTHDVCLLIFFSEQTPVGIEAVDLTVIIIGAKLSQAARLEPPLFNPQGFQAFEPLIFVTV